MQVYNEDEVKEFKKKIAEQEKLLQICKTTHGGTTEDLYKNNAAFEKIKEQNSRLHEELAEKENHFQQLHDKAIAERDTAYNTLLRRFDAKEKQLATKKNQHQLAEGEVSLRDDDYKLLERKLAETKETNQSLFLAVDELRVDCAVHEKKIDDLKQEMLDLRKFKASVRALLN